MVTEDSADTDKDVPVIATTPEMLSTGVDLPSCSEHRRALPPGRPTALFGR